MNFQNLFEGYQQTPLLWNGVLQGMRQYQLLSTNAEFIPSDTSKKLRLGRWVERFVIHQIHHSSELQLLSDSLQIRRDKHTLGELDVLFKNKSQPAHLECVYKFYLYDHTKSYKNILDPWIGPNRTDALVQKLDKLRLKQLPLLHHPITQTYLNELGYSSLDIEQVVQFKAQLFLPLDHFNIELGPLNRNCISGFHCHFKNLVNFKAFKFYVPRKLDWLAIPQLEVDWLGFKEAYKNIKDQCAMHRSPMIWLKDPEDNLQKAFFTWW